MNKGYHKQIHFDNGYGLSIVSHEFSYGGKIGMFEIALLDSESKEIVYNPDLGFTDVLGYLGFEDVVAVIQRVRDYVHV